MSQLAVARSKYGNRKVIEDGYKFDSLMERNYYRQLKWLLQYKEIVSFKLQPRYVLQEGFKKNSKTYRKIEYVADFEVLHQDGSIEVIDVKGAETEAFGIKKKLFEAKYPHKLSVLTYSRENGGWMELDALKKKQRKQKVQKGKR